ncbi:MAG: type II secretion system F family protein [Oligoflexales bacterium]
MKEFKYKALQKNGVERSGKVSAPDAATARKRLKHLNLTNIKIISGSKNEEKDSPKSKIINIWRDEYDNVQIEIFPQKPTIKDIMLFTKQMSTMIKAGIPVLQSLSLMAENQSNRAFKDAIESMKEQVENGVTLSEAMKESKVFTNLYLSMIQAGEASGQLAGILEKLAVYLEKEAKMKSKVVSSLIYPSFVLFAGVGVLTFMLVFVVPALAEQALQTGQALPEMTQFVLDVSNFLSDNGAYIVSGLAVSMMIFSLWVKTPKGHFTFDRLIIQSPIVGSLLLKSSLARFSTTLASMLSAGVSLLEALDICAVSTGNLWIESLVRSLRESLASGENFTEPLKRMQVFPKIVISMVSIGEQSGSLDQMLQKISDYYEEEVDHAVEVFLAQLPTLLIAVLGGLVGFIVVAMYLPIFDMASGF